jgi:hypothetical protein
VKSNAKKRFDPAMQRVWLLQHIPHRICAALTWLKMDGNWAMLPDPEWKDKSKDKFHIWCIGRSVDEGRKAAMRWLIEFVGVAMTKETREPKRPEPLRGHEDEQVLIDRFDHGELFDLNNKSDALILANAWKGCTQASMHATKDTAHPPVDPKVLERALAIVIKHLEISLYEPNKHLYESGFNLLEVVRDQEERNRFLLIRA